MPFEIGKKLFFEFIFYSQLPHQKILEKLDLPDFLGIKSEISHSVAIKNWSHECNPTQVEKIFQPTQNH